MVARFKSKYTKISVIQCYALTNDAEEETNLPTAEKNTR